MNTSAEVSGFKTAKAPERSGSTPMTQPDSTVPQSEFSETRLPQLSGKGKTRESNQFDFSWYASKLVVFLSFPLLPLGLDFGFEGSETVTTSGTEEMVVVGEMVAKSLNAAGVRRRRDGGEERRVVIKHSGFGGN